MDYEKAYKQALERAKRLGTLECPIDPLRTIGEQIFPELENSVNERMIECIRLALTHVSEEIFAKFGTNLRDTLAWLEKQGASAKLSEEEQNKIAKGVLSSCALSFIDYLDVHKYEGKMCVSNGECADIEDAFHNAMWDRLHRYYCKYIEKQREQKPTDKVEPKIHIEKIKRNYEQVDTFDRGNIEKEFPELVENKDERIRRKLIELVEESTALIDGDDYPKMISWLEKQNSDLVSEAYERGYTEGMRVKNKEWLEKQKPTVTPKFKAGDVVRDIEDGELLTIRTVTDDEYLFTNDEFCFINEQEFFELVEQNSDECSEGDLFDKLARDVRIQYASIDDGIKSHAVTYSYNIESQLFPQLNEEQQKLWRKEIEQAVISGGNVGVNLANDERYKENTTKWSEEDDKISNECISAIWAADWYSMDDKNDMENWLKSLKQRIGE